MSIRVPGFSAARVLVVGDVMLDRYWSGRTGRISPEAPVPVVSVLDQEDRLGGAANVAANLRTLGVQVGVLGLLGHDEAGQSIEDLLGARDIRSYCLYDQQVSTIIKLRVLSQNQQMIRLDFEQALDASLNASMQARLAKALPDFDVVVFSDYAKGSLQDVAALIKQVKAQDKMVFVDPKGEDFSRYKYADVITPNQTEFEVIVGQSQSDAEFQQKAQQLHKTLELGYLLITRSEHGMYLQSAQSSFQVQAQAKEVHDVTGAGDTVMAVLAASLAVGESMNAAVELANVAAGVVVGKVGTSTLSTHELRHALHTQGIGGGTSHSQAELALLMGRLQAQNKKIVMTNGCFDILHAGHIAFLQEAKAQGDYLLVAVNDDASVSRLKGAERPVNRLQDRIAVLAALSAVDWVIPFSEDTPQALIADLLPDVLVKGGDYEIDQIAGGQEVIAAGGEVRVLMYHDGRSTTRIIDRIRKKD